MSISCVECREGPIVLYRSQLLSATKRPRIPLFEYLRGSEGSDALTLCSYCHGVLWEGGGAPACMELEQYYARGGSSQVLI